MVLDTKSTLRDTLTVAFVAMLMAGLILVALHFTGYDVIAAVRDTALSDAPEAGLISNIGILLMSAAALVSLVGAWQRSYIPLALLALFCTLFALDDGLMLHEQLGQWEILLISLHGILLLAVLALYWRDTQLISFPLIICVLAFGLSASIDLSWLMVVDLIPISSSLRNFLSSLSLVVEDLPKLAGIALLFSFSIGESQMPKQYNPQGKI